MLVKGHDGIGQYTMKSVIVCMIDILIVIEIFKVNSKIIWHVIVI